MPSDISQSTESLTACESLLSISVPRLRFSTVPSCPYELYAIRAATLSVTGTLIAVEILVWPRLPYCIFAYPDVSPVGLADIRLINPPVTFLPYKVPCGPESISILSASKKPISANAEEFMTCPFTAVWTDPTLDAPIASVALPLIPMKYPEPIAGEKVTPGVNSPRSYNSVTCWASRSSLVKAWADRATSWSDSSLLVAVTTTSSTSTSWAVTSLKLVNIAVARKAKAILLKLSIIYPP